MSGEVKLRQAQDFVITCENVGAATKAIFAMKRDQDFSMPKLDDLDQEEAWVIAKVFDLFEWPILADSSGNITEIRYADRSGKLTSAARLLFDTVAPFVEDGSFFEFESNYDESNINRLVFWRGKCHFVAGEIVFEMPKEKDEFYQFASLHIKNLEPKNVRSALIEAKSILNYEKLKEGEPNWDLSGTGKKLTLELFLGDVRTTKEKMDFVRNRIRSSLVENGISKDPIVSLSHK